MAQSDILFSRYDKLSPFSSPQPFPSSPSLVSTDPNTPFTNESDEAVFQDVLGRYINDRKRKREDAVERVEQAKMMRRMAEDDIYDTDLDLMCLNQIEKLTKKVPLFHSKFDRSFESGLDYISEIRETFIHDSYFTPTITHIQCHISAKWYNPRDGKVVQADFDNVKFEYESIFSESSLISGGSKYTVKKITSEVLKHLPDPSKVVSQVRVLKTMSKYKHEKGGSMITALFSSRIKMCTLYPLTVHNVESACPELREFLSDMNLICD